MLRALPRRGRWGGAGGWGCGAPRARSRAPLTFAGAARTHFRGLRAGGAGPSGGPAAGPPGKSGASRCPGLGPARAPGSETPMEEPPGTARGAGSRPRRSPAIAPSPADAGGARISGRKRLSHFLRAPHSSAPSAPDLPSLSPAPFPSPAARVGAGKTRNLNGCSVRRLPPGQVSSRSQPPAWLPALPTVPRAPTAPRRQCPCLGALVCPRGDEPRFNSRPQCLPASFLSCLCRCLL